jgi:polyhydroxybutyrate depolymerase
MMAFTLACLVPDLFAGVGTIIASMPRGLDARALRPVPFVMINGTNDPVIPYAGGEVGLHGGRGDVLGVEETAALLARIDGCEPVPVVEPMPRLDAMGTTSVTRLSWRGCRPGASVTLYRVEGAGHTIPGRPVVAPRLGAGNQDIAAATVVMDVFAGGPEPG